MTYFTKINTLSSDNLCMFKKLLKCLLFVSLFLSSHKAAIALTCGLPGKDGVGVVSASVNTYYPPAGTSAPGIGSKTLSLGAGVGPTGFTAGDLLLIIQMQDSSGTLEGNFEYAQVASVSGGAVTLASGLVNNYAQSFGPTTLQTYQVIRVPQYSAATITGTVSPPAWTVDTLTGIGTGGVFVMDVAGTLTVSGTINANGKGFRGAYGIHGTGNQAGAAFNTDSYTPNLTNISGALKGEGTNGVPNQVFTGVVGAMVYTSGLYAAGTAGQGANGNAGGGGNDGNPPAGGNGNNSGGGGGGNAGAGGIGGKSWGFNNDAGGRGGLLQSSGASKLYLGGGGGAGTMNNNGVASTVTAYPPTTPFAPNTGNGSVPNGATGAVSGSGAAGGGIVILRASSVAYTSGGIQANGIAAYTSSSSSDGSGGGGAGGSVIVQAASSTGMLPISAVGGRGGDAGYYDHGPGGGGGGGFIGTSGVTTTSTAAGGASGLDANNGGNLTPDAYGATTGGSGVANGSFSTPPTGAGAPNACLPNISVVKTTSTPAISVSGATTATYTITATNASAGFATGVDFVDNALPPGWTFGSTTSIVFAPPLSSTVLGGFVEGTTPGVPLIANSPGAAFNLTTNGLPAAAPIWSNVTIPGNGTATLTYTVNIPASAPAGVYHNPAGVKYLDPTRSTAGREVTATSNNTANRAGAQVGGTTNSTYEGGSVAGTSVVGSNYNGLVAGSAGEDITLQADLRVVKTNSGTFLPASTAAGGTYTIAVSNVGRAVQALTYAADQATPATVSALLGAPYTVTDTLPTGMTLANAPTIAGAEAANWVCTGVAGDASFTCTRNAAAGNIAPGNVTPVTLATISAPVRVTLAACPGPLNNTAVLSNASIGEIVTTDNTSTSSTTMNCTASVVISKTDNKAVTTTGATNTYLITLTNNGPAAADGVFITDVVGAGLTCPAASLVTCTVLAGAAVCPTGPFTIANLTAATGITIATLPATGSVQLSYACTTN
jgi:uncharacterized repeat protein (TIGR01451 family)